MLFVVDFAAFSHFPQGLQKGSLRARDKRLAPKGGLPRRHSCLRDAPRRRGPRTLRRPPSPGRRGRAAEKDQ
eukprot:7061563-Heterocapsa_arctica.AAC.1